LALALNKAKSAKAKSAKARKFGLEAKAKA